MEGFGGTGRGGAPSPPGLGGVDGGSVGADLCVGPWTGPVRRRFRADTWVRPYAVGEASRNQRKLVRKRTLPTGRDGARPLRGSGAGRCVQDGGVRSPRPTGATQVVPSSGPPGSSAPTEGVGSCRNHPGQRRTAKRLRRGWEEWVESEAEITPEVSSNAGQCQLPLHKGAFGDGGCGLPCRFAPRNDSPDPLSFRGGPTGRRGNPSFLQWTGVRAAVPRAWPPPTKFRAEIWGVGQVVVPYGRQLPLHKEAFFPAGDGGRLSLRSGRQGRRVFSPWMGVSISGALNQAFRIWTAAGVMLAPAPAFSTTMATAISGSS